MAERLTPGVYVEEVSGGVKPIQGLSTSTAGFIGETGRGIPNRAEFINGFRDFDRKFGGHRRGQAGFMAQAVEAFFNAGGRRAYVVRVLPSNATSGSSQPVDAREDDTWGIRRQVLQFAARGNGAWSEHIRIHLEPSTAFQTQAFRVRVEWTEAGQSRTVETFDNVRMDPMHEDYVVDVINETSRYIRATDLFAQDFLDAETRLLPPIPERAAALESEPAVGGVYEVPVGAKFDFRWRDNAAAASAEAEVEFTNTAVINAGGTVDSDNTAQLTPGQLRQLLSSVLGNAFRVTGPVTPAEVASDPGPWDTTGGDRSVVRIDNVNSDLIYAQTTPAEINLGPGPFNLNDADVIELTINGELQQYTLVPGDVTPGAATLAEVMAVLNREFTGIQAFPRGADLILRTDRLGSAASLAVGGTAAAGLGNPAPASGSGNVSAPAAVTAEELAAIFNAIPNNPFEARVDGNRARFVQIDFAQSHTIQWVSDPGPDTIVADTNPHTGPTAAENVRIEPAVATRAYLLLQPLTAGTPFDVSATNQITITATDGATPTTFQVDVSADASLTPAVLQQRIEAAFGAGTNTYNVEVDDAGDYVVLTAEANPTAGVTLSVSVDAGSPWQLPRSIAGQPGTGVDSHNAVEIIVSEEIQLGVPRALRTLFAAVRATGLDENHQANPDLRPRETEDEPLRLLGGTDGTGPVSVSDYAGSDTAEGRTGLHAFDTVEVNLLIMPGKNSPGLLSVAMTYCDANDVFFIADGAGSIDRRFQMSADDARQFVEGLPARSNNASMFYPWIDVPDPVGVGRNPRRFVPPSGHIAGIFARTDVTRGVWKAPAGIEALVNGAVDLQHQLTDADQDLLNPIGLNCLRQFPNTGIVSWGARTLASDPEWRYVPVRRTALFLKRSLQRGLQWAVFEPNDQELWDRIRINITAFMLGLFRQGAFQGATPDEAFLVKCDRETNPQELVDQGIVTAQVAFAPLKPAEFVVIELSQKTLVA
jgi:phage tail sheath protein FI